MVLAEAVSEAYDAKEAYRYEEDGVETIGWYFAATLRQPFEYAEYPFDEQDLWLRIWPRDFSRDIILVPDFDVVQHDASRQPLPGIESEFVYSGWTPVYSGFSFSDQPYDSSFGIGDAGQYPDFPDLYFNLVLDRNFAGPFFEYLRLRHRGGVSALRIVSAHDGRREPEEPLPAQYRGGAHRARVVSSSR